MRTHQIYSRLLSVLIISCCLANTAMAADDSVPEEVPPPPLPNAIPNQVGQPVGNLQNTSGAFSASAPQAPANIQQPAAPVVQQQTVPAMPAVPLALQPPAPTISKSAIQPGVTSVTNSTATQSAAPAPAAATPAPAPLPHKIAPAMQVASTGKPATTSTPSKTSNQDTGAMPPVQSKKQTKPTAAQPQVKKATKAKAKPKAKGSHHKVYPKITDNNITDQCCNVGKKQYSEDDMEEVYEVIRQQAPTKKSGTVKNRHGQVEMSGGCPLTPEIWEVESRQATHPSNDLRRLSGSPYLAEGKGINIVGRVVDQNCVPVTGARIQLVQADSLGRYADNPARDRGFTGSGIAFTDNLGRYSFFSVMPGPTKNRAPHINFSIDHPDIQHFETEMFFPDNLAAEHDAVLRAQVASEQRDLLFSKYIGYNINEGIDVYEFSVTLNGSLNYKTY